jgi:hypothetical protein
MSWQRWHTHLRQVGYRYVSERLENHRHALYEHRHGRDALVARFTSKRSLVAFLRVKAIEDLCFDQMIRRLVASSRPPLQKSAHEDIPIAFRPRCKSSTRAAYRQDNTDASRCHRLSDCTLRQAATIARETRDLGYKDVLDRIAAENNAIESANQIFAIMPPSSFDQPPTRRHRL